MSRPTQLDDRVDQRLTDLEIKLSFTEDLVDHLNQQVAEQQRLIAQLTEWVRLLRQQQAGQDGPAAFRNLRDELPPHY